MFSSLDEFPRVLPHAPLSINSSHSLEISHRDTFRFAGATHSIDWIGSSEQIPLDAQKRIKLALFDNGLLNATYNFELTSASTRVSVECFDSRGSNRKVMLLKVNNLTPVVLKISYGTKLVEFGQSSSKTIEEQFDIMNQIKEHPNTSQNVVAPYAHCKVDGRIVFTEEYVEGVTRGDYLSFLQQRGVIQKEAEFNLSRLEGRALAKIFLSRKSKYNSDQGLIIGDLTERNSKFYLNNGKLEVVYFDFEAFDYCRSRNLVTKYSNDGCCYNDFFKNPGFALGIVEGIGIDSAIKLFLLHEFKFDDKLGAVITILKGFEMSESYRKRQFSKDEILEFAQKIILNEKKYIEKSDLQPIILRYMERNPDFRNDPHHGLDLLSSYCSLIDDAKKGGITIKELNLKLRNLYNNSPFLPDSMSMKYQYFSKE